MIQWAWFLIGVVTACASMRCRSASAQHYPISNPPVEQHVPQYHPVYPLHDIPANQSMAPSIAPGSRHDQVENGSVIVDLPPMSAPPLPELNPVATPVPLAGSDNVPRVDKSASPQRFPVDPRKPCNACTHPNAARGWNRFDLPGLHGRPYQYPEPGGNCCGKQGCGKKGSPICKQASVYWPRPFSVFLPHHRDSSCPQKRLVDVFDPLVNFKLIPYQRTDNGYCGPGADPYGCLGESRYRY